MGNVGVVQMDASLYVCDRQGNRLRDISDQIVTGTVSMNEDNRRQQTFAFTLKSPNLLRDWTEYVQPHLKMTYNDGTVEQGPLGLYIVLPPVELTHTGAGTRESFDCADLTWIPDNDSVEFNMNIVGTKTYTQAIKDLLLGSGITRVQIPSTTRTLGAVKSYQAGTPILDMCNDLCKAIGWYPLYCTNTGIMTTQPFIVPAGAQPAVTYNMANRGRVNAVIVEQPDTSQVANVVMVENDQVGQPDPGTGIVPPPIFAVRINSNPASPTSTTTTKVRIVNYVRDSSLVDQAAADALANKLMSEAHSYKRQAALTVVADPRRGLHEVWAVDLRNNAERTIMDGKWLARSWEVGFTPTEAQMTANLYRVQEYV